MKYRKKPVTIDAVQWLDHRFSEETLWIRKALANNTVTIKAEKAVIKTLEGNMVASPKDYIIRGVNGELYPCKPEIFHKTYEKV